MALVIDTSALISLERNRSQGRNIELPWEEMPVLPAIVWTEALIGVRLAKSSLTASKRRAFLEAIRRVSSIESFGPEQAEHYVDIYAELKQSGLMIPQNDMAVAATARKLNAAVLVGPKDEEHFRWVPNLDVIVLDS